MDVTPGPAFTNADVEAGIHALIENQYGVERADLGEIVQIVLSYASGGMRRAVYQAGREAEAQRIAERLWAESDAATCEHDRVLLSELALMAQDLNSYAKAYPIGIAKTDSSIGTEEAK